MDSMGCIGIFMHLYLYNKNKEKEGHEFVREWGSTWERLEREKREGGKMIESHLIKQ